MKSKSNIIAQYIRRNVDLSIQLTRELSKDTNLIVVIPSFNEMDLVITLESLENCTPAKAHCAVIVIFNSSEAANAEIKNLHIQQAQSFKNYSGKLQVRGILIQDIPRKKAGVGYARKIGMDLALQHFASNHNESGVIACLDGDCTVASNYFIELENYFLKTGAKQAIHLHFEHPFPTDQMLRNSIVAYETHLRLMRKFISQTGHPQAFHAVGSCLAVCAWAYAAQGGMNKKQAGEDFYFIHKYSAINELENLATTTVYPSARLSDRVPFGTGAAMTKIHFGENQFTYHPASYKIIKDICQQLPTIYNDVEKAQFLFRGFYGLKLIPQLEEIKLNTRGYSSFQKRFYQWFDAFKLIKFLHYLREYGFLDVPIEQACQHHFDKQVVASSSILESYLIQLRAHDKSAFNHVE